LDLRALTKALMGLVALLCYPVYLSTIKFSTHLEKMREIIKLPEFRERPVQVYPPYDILRIGFFAFLVETNHLNDGLRVQVNREFN
jgi:hypothetical protein